MKFMKLKSAKPSQIVSHAQQDIPRTLKDRRRVFHVFQVNLILNLQWRSAQAVQQTLLQISQSRQYVQVAQQGKLLHW